MCGIAGVCFKSGETVTSNLLQKFSKYMAHRGPDGEGIFADGNIGLVHRRLSIIDIHGGAQPISDINQKLQIIGNGEIYNYATIQMQLQRDEVALKTGSDIEVALHLYKKYGLSFVKYLRGMYALAVYNSDTQEVILARDPFGIKPLYITENEFGVAFASEPSVLTKSGLVEAKVNTNVVASLFNRQYVGGTETLFEGITRLKPGEVIVIKNGIITSRNQFPINMLQEKESDIETALQEFDSKFNSSINLHLQSEVPYGAFLSGGVDSSAVVIKMAELEPKIKTFTIGFNSKSVADERNLAEKLANTLHTEHSSITFSEEDFWDYLPKMCNVMDDLVADYAALPLLKLSEYASKDVKVILSGEGGDEFFAGYGRYKRSWLDKLKGRPFRGYGETYRYSGLFKYKVTSWKDASIASTFSINNATKLQKLQARDIADWLPDDLLTKLDRCLMAYGIEGRVPFVDKIIAPYGFSLEDSLKIKHGKGKWLLKTWLADKLNALGLDGEIRVWGKKKGFTVPVAQWLENKRPQLSTYMVNHKALVDYVNINNLQEFLKEPLTKKSGKLVFTLLCYCMWFDVHISGKNYKSLYIK